MKYVTEYRDGKNYVRTYDEKKNGLRQEGDMEFNYWVCQVGEEKHVCKDTKKCPYFIGLDEVLNER